MAVPQLKTATRTQGNNKPLKDGVVKPKTFDFAFEEVDPIIAAFRRMVRANEFDICEMAITTYICAKEFGKPMTAVPVPLLRAFHHGAILVNSKAGINAPKDLEGKKVGVNRGYTVTTGVWIRGILQDEYGVPVDTQTYYQGGEEEPNRPEKLKLELPPNIKVAQIGERDTLAAMLRDGSIDALYTARMPSTYQAGKLEPVRRLFENYMEVEQAYYRKTKIFPIMHTVAIRREVYEAYPWVAMNLYKAFVQAQRECYEDLYVTAALKTSLPWLTKHVEDARALMGDDFWPYGFGKNRETLATFLRYHHEQGLSKRRLEPEELFAPETLESFVI
jgi:4,5-dihydroxyphthalate decarboxylase